MASSAGTLKTLARQLGLALQPLKDELAPERVLNRLAEAGLALPPAVLANPGFSAALASTSNAAGALSALVPQLATRIASGDEAGIVSIGAQVIQQIGSTLTSLDAVGPALKAAGPLPGVNAGELASFADALPSRLLGRRVISFLEDLQPSIVGIGNFLGVLDRLPEPGVPGDALHPPFVIEQLQLSRLGDVLQSPAAVLKSLYGWGEPGFDGSLLMPRLATSLSLLGLPAYVDDTGKGLEAGFMKLRVVPGAPPGLSAALSVPILSGIDVTLPLTATWSARARAQGVFAAGLRIDVTPPSTVTMKPEPPGGPLNGELSVDLIARGPDRNRPLMLFGQTGGSRLQADSISIGAGLAPKWDAGAGRADASPAARFAVTGGRAVIDPPKIDSFLDFITGGLGGEVGFSLSGTWSPADGLRFDGSAGLEIALPAHASLGPARLETLYLRAGIEAGSFPVEISAALGATLGPLEVAVDRIGVVARLSFPKSGGNLGPLNLAFEPKLPGGIGLSLDAGGFKGGGFLRLDPDKGEYEGGLELTFLAVVSVRAIAILTTRMPDGGDGFSLLILLVSEFPPLQLSYGFTLVGIGGLMGLNRTVLLGELQAGVHDGSLNSILFPTDVVANAARILGDLKRVFPPQDGHFLVGPMAKLGWGTPTLISLSLGLILDIPRPMFAILGVLHMALPTEDVPILHLQVSFAGSVDFGRGQLRFDASLFDSRVMTFTLTGDMAVRVYWMENANFLLTVGGFHPAYTPPPMDLGELARLGMVLFQGNPHISARVYFAVTSNTVQFGAQVEAYYGIELFNVYGFLGLDVLINFDPFHFVAEIEAELGVRSNSTVLFAIQLQFVLEGPSPWHARGTGSFRIGFIIKVTISAGFDVTFGDARETKLPPADVLGEVAKALGNLGNWRPRLPPASNQHVTLRELPDPAKTLVLHPYGALEITQKLVPLHIAIQRFGSRAPSAGSVFTLADVKLGGEDAAVANTREQFAPAQFFTLSDAEKLSRPSFADYDAGIVIGGDLAPRTDLMRTRDVAYELIYLPEHHPVRLIFKLAVELAGSIVRGSAVAQSPVSHAQRSVSVLEERASLAPESYAVVSTEDLTLHAPHLVFDSATAADQAVQRLVGERPELFGAIQVLPATAAARAA